MPAPAWEAALPVEEPETEPAPLGRFGGRPDKDTAVDGVVCGVDNDDASDNTLPLGRPPGFSVGGCPGVDMTPNPTTTTTTTTRYHQSYTRVVVE